MSARASVEAGDSAGERPPATLALPSTLAYAVAVVALIVAVIQPVAVFDQGLTLSEAVDGFFLQNAVSFAVLGALILWRRPGHAIGWLLVLVGGLDALTHVGDEYALFDLGELSGFPPVVKTCIFGVCSTVGVRFSTLPGRSALFCRHEVHSGRGRSWLAGMRTRTCAALRRGAAVVGGSVATRRGVVADYERSGLTRWVRSAERDRLRL